VSRTRIYADEELLQRALTVLGTAANTATVNAALAKVVALGARRQFLEDAWRGELADAADDGTMDRAWRQ
jgi:Arc/MetJ family transcription regulator